MGTDAPQPEDETEEELDIRRVRIRNAAAAVARSAPPPLLHAIHERAVTWPTGDPANDVETVLVAAVEQSWNEEVILAWWLEHALALRGVLTVLVQDLDEVEASFLLHVALQARQLAGASLTEDQVLRVAERAATWAGGRDAILLAGASGFR